MVACACDVWHVVLADMECVDLHGVAVANCVLVCLVVDAAAAGWTSGGTCEAVVPGTV